jgi:hypothetical protein
LLGSLAPDTRQECRSCRSLQTNSLLVFDVKVEGYPSVMRTLVDTGASQNYARRITVATNATMLDAASSRSNGEISVRMADGATTKTKKIELELSLKFLDFQGKSRFFVIDLDERYDLILGMPWLKANQPWIDWSEGTMGSSTPPVEPHYYSALESHVPSTAVVVADPRQTRDVSVMRSRKTSSAKTTPISHFDASVVEPKKPVRELVATRESRSHEVVEPRVGVPSRPSERTAGTRHMRSRDADEMVLSICDLSKLPSTAPEVCAMPELEYEEFLAALSSHEIRGIAMLCPEFEELNTSSTMDEDVEDTKQSRFDSQSWESLRASPYFDLLWEFRDVFPEKIPDQLPSEKGIRHEIDLEPGAKYCVTRQWPLPREQVEAIDAFFAARKIAGHVRESNSPHSSPTFCVKKATGGWRIVHAFNKLNAATIPAQTPIPRKDVIIDGMSGSTVFSTMDLTDGFYQILMRLADVSKTAVSTPSGMLWEWLVMPQGLKNAPATFNRVTTHLLRPCRAFAPSYFDDIYIHSRTSDGKSDVEMHRLHLREVLTILRANGLYANLKKCIFGAPEIPVLGDFVGIDGVRADPEKIRSINEWPVPSSVKDLRKWLGLGITCTSIPPTMPRWSDPCRTF